jgi:hypothetical protein
MEKILSRQASECEKGKVFTDCVNTRAKWPECLEIMSRNQLKELLNSTSDAGFFKMWTSVFFSRKTGGLPGVTQPSGLFTSDPRKTGICE